MSNEITTTSRTMEEITASVRLNMQNMVNSALNLGMDLMDAKEACGHGRWLPWLKSVGISSSTANNYMRIAREVSADSAMARLPYSKVLALLSLPPEEREEVAEKADDMSAAEIRRLTEERNKAAEAANTESARADQAEEHARKFYGENAHLRDELMTANYKLEQEQQKSQELYAKLLAAENNRVEVEVPPADYELIKSQLAAAKQNANDLIRAAAEAEQRAEEAETALADSMMQADRGREQDASQQLRQAVNAFLGECDPMLYQIGDLARNAEQVERDVERLRHWCSQMLDKIQSCIIDDGTAVMFR